MPENFSESKHIASLDFDISEIDAQLKLIEDKIRATGVTLEQIIKNNFQFKTNAEQQVQSLVKQQTALQNIRSLYEQSAKLQSQIKVTTVSANTVFQKEVSAIRQKSEEFFNQYKVSGKITDEMKEQTAELKKQLQLIQTQASINSYDNPVVNNKSMLSEIASKAKWYVAGSAAFAGGYVAKEAIRTMTDVEYKVMEITRVMNDSTLDVQSFRQSLLGLAVDYGTSFEDVSEIALRFAQAGYNVNETISLTKDSLLALNTAELDVENSTQSMIGIMQQWGLGANDMALVIDKINKTGDDFAVTSQDIVDGLLRSSSAAKNAKMSFNETVGAITALRTASGRSGNEVGNALNSLIAYTQRDKSLKTFESLGVKVYADEAKTQLTPILDMWGQLSAKVQAGGETVANIISQQTDLTSLYNEELAIATDTQGEYAQALQAENAANQEGLTDLEKRAAYETAGMYRRNYLMALLGNFSQVQEVVNNLQDAEGYSMRENVKTMETLQKKYNSLIAALKNLAVEAGDSGLVGLAKGALDLATALTKASSSGLGMSALLAGIALSYTLLSKEAKVFGIYSIASWKEMGAAVVSAGSKIKAYSTGQEVAKTATKATTAEIALQNAALTFGLSIAIQLIIELYQNWAKNNKSVSATMKEINEELDQSLKTAESNRIAKEAEIATAEKNIKALEDMQKGENGLAENKGRVLYLIDAINKILPDANLKYNEQTGVIEGLNNALTTNIELMRQKVLMEANTEKLTTYAKAELAAKEALETKQKELGEIETRLEENKSKLAEDDAKMGRPTNYPLRVKINNDTEKIEKIKKEISILQAEADKATKTAEDFSKSINSPTEPTDKKPAIDTTKILSDFYKQTQQSSSGAKDLSNGLAELGTALSNAQTGASMSMDDILRFTTLYPELSDKVKITADGYYIEATALKEVALAEQNKVIAQQLGIVTTAFAKTATQEKKDELAKLVQNLNSAKDAEAKLTAQTAIYMLLAKNATGSTGDFATELSKLKNLISVSGDLLGSDLTKSGTQSANQKLIKALQAESKKVQDEKADQIKAEQKLLSELKEDYENQIKTVKEYYDTEIEGLRRAKEERDRSNQREDMQADIEYWSKRTGVEAADNLAEAKKKLAEAEDNWDIDDEIQSLEDIRDYKIKNLESERDLKIKEHEETIERWQAETEASKEKYEADIENAQNAGAAIKGVVNETANNINNALDSIGSKADEIAEAVTTHIKTLNLEIRNNIDSALAAITEYKAKMAEAVASNASWSERTRLFNQYQSDRATANSFAIPSSHTGSMVTKDGGVNVQAGEIIIRKDLTQGLEKALAPFMGGGSSTTNTTNISNTSSNDSPTIININAPINNVEKQEINDGGDVQLSKNDINRAITKALSTRK